MVAPTAARIRAFVRADVDFRRNVPEPAELRAIRINSHWSQKKVADVADVSRSAVSHWESGRRRTPRDLDGFRRYIEVLQALREAA
jgi:DNA-binding transcriptional regulator YiaG